MVIVYSRRVRSAPSQASDWHSRRRRAGSPPSQAQDWYPGRAGGVLARRRSLDSIGLVVPCTSNTEASYWARKRQQIRCRESTARSERPARPPASSPTQKSAPHKFTNHAASRPGLRRPPVSAHAPPRAAAARHARRPLRSDGARAQRHVRTGRRAPSAGGRSRGPLRISGGRRHGALEGCRIGGFT